MTLETRDRFAVGVGQAAIDDTAVESFTQERTEATETVGSQTVSSQTRAAALNRFAAAGQLRQAQMGHFAPISTQQKVDALKSDPGFGSGFWHAIRDTGTDIWSTVELVGDLFDPVARQELKQSFSDIADALQGENAAEVMTAIGTQLGGGLVDAFTKFGDNPTYYTGYIAGTVVAGGAISKLAKIGKLAKVVKSLRKGKALSKTTKARRRNPLNGHHGNKGTDVVSQSFSNTARHLDEAGTIGKRSKGINGGHRPSKFNAALKDQGKVTGRKPVPGMDGVEVVEYKLFQQKPDGTLLKTLGSKPHTKTLFDPAKWPNDKLETLMKDVFGDAVGDGTFTRTVDGNKFIGWVREGELKSFGIVP